MTSQGRNARADGTGPVPDASSRARLAAGYPFRIILISSRRRQSRRSPPVIVVGMAWRKEILEVAGRTVPVSNPDKVYFPQTGHTKLDVIRYYLAVAEGALRGVAGRPMVLKRFVNGAAEPAFFQKRAPSARPDWIETVELSFPSGRDRRGGRRPGRGGARLGGEPGLHRPQPAPGPRRRPGSPGRAPGRPRSGPRRGWPQIVAVALVARDVLADFGLAGWPKTSGSRGIHVYARIEPRWTFTEVRGAAVALAREIERRAPDLATSRWWKEERHGVFVDYNQNAKDRTVARRTRCGRPRTRGSRRRWRGTR